MAKDYKQFQKKYAGILARAWGDESFKQRLLTEPLAVLQEHGINVPPGIQIRALELEPKTFYVTVPPRPVVSSENLRLAKASQSEEDPTGTSIDGAVIMGSFSIGADPDWP